MIKRIKEKSGTTLIEILMYFTTITIIIFVAMTFALRISTVSLLSSNYSEINTNLDLITTVITDTIHSADSVNDASSIFDDTDGAISLLILGGSPSPVTFSLSSGDLTMQQGALPVTTLNSDDVQIDDFSIQGLQFNKSPDHLIFDITASPTGKDIGQTNKTISIHFAISLMVFCIVSLVF